MRISDREYSHQLQNEAFISDADKFAYEEKKRKKIDMFVDDGVTVAIGQKPTLSLELSTEGCRIGK